MRLIDVDAFRKSMWIGEDCSTCHSDLRDCIYNKKYTTLDICKLLSKAPIIPLAVDKSSLLPPVREAKWVPSEFSDSEVMCSSCSYSTATENALGYCPRCGSRMTLDQGFLGDYSGPSLDYIIPPEATLDTKPDPNRKDNSVSGDR